MYQSRNFVSGFNEFMEFKITSSSNLRMVNQHFSDSLTCVRKMDSSNCLEPQNVYTYHSSYINLIVKEDIHPMNLANQIMPRTISKQVIDGVFIRGQLI